MGLLDKLSERRVNKVVEDAKNDLQTFSDYEIRVMIETICHQVNRNSPNFNVKMLMLQTAMNEYIKRQSDESEG